MMGWNFCSRRPAVFPVAATVPPKSLALNNANGYSEPSVGKTKKRSRHGVDCFCVSPAPICAGSFAAILRSAQKLNEPTKLLRQRHALATQLIVQQSG